jgi:hypothetical protein
VVQISEGGILTMMYLNNLNEGMRLRMTLEQKNFIIEMSGKYGISPSEYMRMLINWNMSMCSKGDSHEDEQTFFDGELQFR